MDISKQIIDDLKNNSLDGNIKEMIINDAMPLDIDTRIACLLYIVCDEDKGLQSMAKDTLNVLEADTLLSFVKSYELDGTMFKSIIASLGKFDKVITTAITHKDFSETVAREILENEAIPVSTLELISINQSMFYKYPKLIDALFNNNRVTKEISDRLTRYREGIIAEERMKRGIQKGKTFSVSEDYDLVKAPGEETEESTGQEEINEEDKITTDLELIDEIYEEDRIFDLAKDPEAEKKEKKKEKENTSIQNIINKLSVSGQIKLAMKGNKEARSILIRSPKKMVAQAVLQNPKINENEVEFYSKLKNLSEELLRTIARNPDWVKKPSIMRGLLYNPKTPASIAMTFLSRVTKKEVRDISKSKSLPQAIRIAAKRIVMQEQAREEKLKRAGKK